MTTLKVNNQSIKVNISINDQIWNKREIYKERKTMSSYFKRLTSNYIIKVILYRIIRNLIIKWINEKYHRYIHN